jgi:dethiobiotin synthetase
MVNQVVIPDQLHIPRLVVAGASSGSGKTTVAVALIRALRSSAAPTTSIRPITPARREGRATTSTAG